MEAKVKFIVQRRFLKHSPSGPREGGSAGWSSQSRDWLTEVTVTLGRDEEARKWLMMHRGGRVRWVNDWG